MSALIPVLPREWEEQAALFKWAKMSTGQEPRLAWLYHIANGEHRSKQTAAKLQRMGVQPGVPDCCLPVPVRRYSTDPDGSERWEQYHGVYLELKRLGSKHACTEAQMRWLGALGANNYAVCIAHGWVAAAEYLCWYLQREDLALALRGYQ